MTFKINYKKIKDIDSINLDLLEINNYQCYSPILEKLFILNDNTFNKIIIKSNFVVKNILEKKSYNLYTCLLENELLSNLKVDVFFKFAPLFDPIKYTTGKINQLSYKHDILPKYNDNTTYSYIQDYNNLSYIDNLFTHITSMLLNEHSFINGINHYGSFLSLKNKFKYNIYDELDVVIDNNEFKSNIDKVFTIDNCFNVLLENINKEQEKEEESEQRQAKPAISILSNSDLTMDTKDICSNNIELLDISENFNKLSISDEIDEFILDKLSYENNNDFKESVFKLNPADDSDSCSSRSSNTDVYGQGDDDDGDDDEGDDDEGDDDEGDDDECDDDEGDDDEGDDEDDEDDDKEMNIYLKDYPVNVIGMEPLDDTLDMLMNTVELNEDIWGSILIQIIFTLILYQDLFSFTHNDLHTSNIMYKKTDKEYIVYCYNNIYYKVPTHGRIWKIIDFGRSIYTFKDVTYCSNSFSKDGDASTQYNFEPYINEDKPKVYPNPSFDLCRLACSLFDYFYDDISEIHDEDLDDIQKLVAEWCCDDKNRNVVYKNNGDERYPDFKLYKMIARQVNKHKPHSQLEKEIFKQYQVQKKSIKKSKIINLDEIIKNVTK